PDTPQSPWPPLRPAPDRSTRTPRPPAATTAATSENSYSLTSARLSSDRKTVYLGVEDLVEVQQMQIGYQLRSATGAPITGEIYHTINKLAPERGERVLAGF
ncbi:MAG: hypothetical protein GY953_57630, partial [bacterium]|nr:hypothetical protein [bacterium]